MESKQQLKSSEEAAIRAYLKRISESPDPNFVRTNEDGSLYLPISIVQALLDDVFLGQWSFSVQDTRFGRKWARGSGIMEATVPHTSIKIHRSGDAGIVLTGNLRTDSPRLEAMILLSCAKKFGPLFGRDLNRFKDDAPLPIVKIEKSDATAEEKRMKILIEDSDDLTELKSYRLLVPASLKELYESRIAELSK